MDLKIKVLLVDDHGVVRDGLSLLLQLDDRIEVCGEAGSLEEAIAIADKTCPDVILLDFKLPDGDGVNGCINIKQRFPKVKIIILTAYMHDHIVIETIRAGADGYLLKNIEGDELIDAILTVHAGGSVMDTIATDVVFNKIKANKKETKKSFNLSPQETRILQMISMGKPNKEIAKLLNISNNTVRNYISNIFKKLNVTNRTEAASLWIRNNIINSDKCTYF